ncbi:MAG: ATP-binding protein [Acidobacteriota bacterium]
MPQANADQPASSAQPLRILCIEDTPADVELVSRVLRRSGIEARMDVVQTPGELEERLESGVYDLVLADYKLPGWCGLDALTVLRARGKNLPFILVTGTLGEDIAVECLKKGVTDYVLKDRLARLPVSVRRALEEQKEQEARRRAEEEIARLAAIVESSRDAILSVNLDGIITTWNAGAARMYGYLAAEAVGRSLSLLTAGRALDEAWLRVDSIRHGEGIQSYETMHLGKGGKPIAVSITVSPLRDRKGEITGASLIVRDITVRKRLADELRHKNEELRKQYRQAQAASRAKDEFLANMSHELRSPLNGIVGFSELMHDGKLGPVSEEHKEYLADILSSARHLQRLINDVLDLSRVEAGRLQFEPEGVSLGELVHEVSDSLHAVAVQKGIQLQTEVDPEADRVVADLAKLRQVLYNYLSNALKFTPEEGHVWVRAKPEGPDAFRLEVEDTGIGIAPEDINRLFAEFQQLDSGTAKKYQGSGLGLALTKRIVEAQGGQVGVASRPGAGSVFYAVLPREARAAAAGSGAGRSARLARGRAETEHGANARRTGTNPGGGRQPSEPEANPRPAGG